MPKIRIEHNGVGQARLWMDDREIYDLRDIAIKIPLDDVMVVTAEVLVTSQFELTGTQNTALILGLRVMPGYELVSEQVSDKITIFRGRAETTQGTRH